MYMIPEISNTLKLILVNCSAGQGWLAMDPLTIEIEISPRKHIQLSTCLEAEFTNKKSSSIEPIVYQGLIENKYIHSWLENATYLLNCVDTIVSISND